MELQVYLKGLSYATFDYFLNFVFLEWMFNMVVLWEAASSSWFRRMRRSQPKVDGAWELLHKSWGQDSTGRPTKYPDSHSTFPASPADIQPALESQCPANRVALNEYFPSFPPRTWHPSSSALQAWSLEARTWASLCHPIPQGEEGYSFDDLRVSFFLGIFFSFPWIRGSKLPDLFSC